MSVPVGVGPQVNKFEQVSCVEYQMLVAGDRSIGGSKGGARDVPPLGVQILSSSCTFRQKNEK